MNIVVELKFCGTGTAFDRIDDGIFRTTGQIFQGRMKVVFLNRLNGDRNAVSMTTMTAFHVQSTRLVMEPGTALLTPERVLIDLAMLHGKNESDCDIYVAGISGGI